MGISAGIAAGVGVAAAAGATAAAVRAAKARAKPNQTPYGASEDVTGRLHPEANLLDAAAFHEDAYKRNVASLGPKPAGKGMDAILWEMKRKEFAKVRDEQYAQAAAYAQETGVTESGYDAAVNPLLSMQQSGAQIYGNTVAGQGQAMQDAQAMQANARARGDMASMLEGRTTVGPQNISAEGAGILGGYQPGAVSTAASSVALNQAAQANLGAARSGGALAMRNALNANGQAGVSLAGQTAAQRAAEEERYLGARLEQANLDRSTTLGQRNTEQEMQLSADESYRQRVLQNQQMNYGLASTALGQRMGALDSQAGQAIQREGLAAQGLDSIRRSQLEADMDYDTRRQQEGQRRSNNLWGLAGGLIGVAGGAFSSMGKK